MSFPPVDDWSDWVRLLIFTVCLFSTIGLLRRYKQHHKTWNVKTTDYWFASLMWSIAGAELVIEGIYLELPFGPRLVFILFASAVGLKGLLRKGDWGSNSD